jgi:hypothetical protein
VPETNKTAQQGGNKMKFNADNWEAITVLMDDDIRERVAWEKVPCEDSDFLRRYLELDPGFAEALRQEFPAELDAAKDGEPKIFVHKDTGVSYTLEELKTVWRDGGREDSFEAFVDNETSWCGVLVEI